MFEIDSLKCQKLKFCQFFSNIQKVHSVIGFPCSSVGKESACKAGDPVLLLGWEDTLEKEMAAQSSILVWEIPLSEEPGGLQSIGSQKSLA